MTAYFKDNPIQAGGKSYGVDIIMKDSQSDPKRAGELAGELINTDGVDILMAHATPETTVPVAAQCEANATPCITADTPWQPWVAGLGGNPGDPTTALKWSYHFFWGLEDMAAVYMDMWNQVDTNKKVAALYPNDADGQAFTDTERGFPAIIGPAGFTFDNPGLYPSGTQDFSSQISAFKANDDQILTGIVPPPDFINFWKQAKQQGYNPKIATIGKAIEFPAAVAALGDLAQNLGDRGVVGADLPDDLEPDRPVVRRRSPRTYTDVDRQAVERHAGLLGVAVRDRRGRHRRSGRQGQAEDRRRA